MMSVKNLTVLAGLAALSFAGAANANTTGGAAPTIGPFSTDFGLGTGANPVTNLVFPLFNSNLGTLTSISFTVGGTVTTTFSGSNPNALNPDNVTLTSQTNISLYAPPVVSPSNLIIFTTPSNVFGPITVPGGANFGPQTVVAPGNSTNPSYSGSFLPFEAAGGGFVSLPVTANGQSNASDTNGNINTSIRTTASAFGSVVYTYTPTQTGVPEPGSVAMLIAGGMTGAGFFIRRRRK